MENENQGGSSYDPSNMTVALAASSMINASDLISPEVYQANLKRIEDMKKVVRTLETNNEMAHKNFLMDQLEQRIQEGRNAEDMLQRLRNSALLPESFRPNDQLPYQVQSETVLPSSATIVEVQENLPARSTPSSTPQVNPYYTAPSSLRNTPQHSQPHYSMPQPVASSPTTPAQYSYVPPITYGHRLPSHQTSQTAQPFNQRAPGRASRQSSFRVDGYNHYPPVYDASYGVSRDFLSGGMRQPEAPQRTSQEMPSVYYPNARMQPANNGQSTTLLGNLHSQGGVGPTAYYSPAQAAPESQPTNMMPRRPYYRQSVSTQQSQIHSPSVNASTLVAPTTSVQSQAYASHVPIGSQPPVVLSQYSTATRASVVPSSQPTSAQSVYHNEPQVISQLPQSGTSRSSSAPQTSRQNTPLDDAQRKNTEQYPLSTVIPAEQGIRSVHQQQLQQPLLQQHQSPHQPQHQQQHQYQYQQQPQPQPQPQQQPHPQQPLQQQRQQSAETGPQPVSVEAFVRVFQQAVDLGPERVAALAVKARNAGVSQAWFDIAIRTIPKQQWKEILQQLPQYLQIHARRQPSSSSASVTFTSSSEPARNLGDSASQPAQTHHAEPSQHITASHALSTESLATTSHSTFATDTTTVAQVQSDCHTAGPVGPVQPTLAVPVSMTIPTTPLLVTSRRSTEVQPSTKRTPQQADRKRLAVDILRSLGRRLPSSSPKKENSKNDAETNNTRPSHATPSSEAPPVESPRPSTTLPVTEAENVQKANEGTVSSVELPDDIGPQLPSESTIALAAVSPSMPPLPPSTSSDTHSVNQDTTSAPLPPPSSIPPLGVGVESKVLTPPKVEQLVISPECPGAPIADAEPVPMVIDLTLDEMDSTTVDTPVSPQVHAQGFSRPSSRHPQPSDEERHSTPTPQLQSLSLEEQYAAPLVHTQIEDMRVSTPPPPAVEMEYIPPPEDDVLEAEPVTDLTIQANFREPSPVKVWSPANGRLPLFLPSPPTSPKPERSSAPPPPDTDDEVTYLGESPSRKRHLTKLEDAVDTTEDVSVTRTRKKPKQQVYVLIPSPPPYVKRAGTKWRRKRRSVDVDVDLVSESSGEQDVDSELEYSQPEPFQYGEAERTMIEDCNSRFAVKTCKWRGCDAILNCGSRLRSHLERHALEDSQEPYKCRWDGCRKKFRTDEQLSLHLQRHAVFPLPCPFEGCDKEFGEPVDAMCHEISNHESQLSPNRKSSLPFVPSLPPKLGSPPGLLPAHRTVPRRVSRTKISAERHAVVGPWVLWHIFGTYERPGSKQNAPMRARPGAERNSEKLDARQDEYDFLLPLSSAPSKAPPLDEMDSPLVTQLASLGLVLWPGEPTLSDRTAVEPPNQLDASSEPAGETPVPPVPADELLGNADGEDARMDLEPTEPASGAMEDESMNEEGPPSPALPREEEAVERMLIV